MHRPSDCAGYCQSACGQADRNCEHNHARIKIKLERGEAEKLRVHPRDAATKPCSKTDANQCSEQDDQQREFQKMPADFASGVAECSQRGDLFPLRADQTIEHDV
ncbi:MAG TPA: hypothetical protein VFK30_10335 [Anaerolineae bacterium]|nr:hypothetical protein [Anaerolineae bacterium]